MRASLGSSPLPDLSSGFIHHPLEEEAPERLLLEGAEHLTARRAKLKGLWELELSTCKPVIIVQLN